MTSRARSAPFAALLAAALALAGCASDQTGALVGPNPPARPRQDVRDHAALVKAFGGEYAAPALKELVGEAMARLRPQDAGEPYTVTLLDSPKVNAFALPSGRLYVTRGLLALATDTSELAAVLSHEMAHLARGHAAQRSEIEARGALISRVAADVLGDREAGQAIRDRSALSLASFSRAQELEADALGIATLAAAGYDASAAPRFLKALGRQAELAAEEPVGSASAGGLSTHPATRERVAQAVAAARKIGGPGPRREERERYMAALDGLAYGDQPSDGLVRGRAFLHPRLGVAFTAPDGMSLENTSRAVLGATRDGRLRLLFDAVDAPAGQSLGELLGASWADSLREGSARTVIVNGRPVALAASDGKDWSFRLAAVRIGPTIFRLVLAGRPGASATLDRDFDATLAGLREIGPDEAATLRPQRIATIAAGPDDTVARLAARMTTDRPLERFRVLNGLEPGEALKPGWRYKVVLD